MNKEQFDKLWHRKAITERLQERLEEKHEEIERELKEAAFVVGLEIVKAIQSGHWSAVPQLRFDGHGIDEVKNRRCFGGYESIRFWEFVSFGNYDSYDDTYRSFFRFPLEFIYDDSWRVELAKNIEKKDEEARREEDRKNILKEQEERELLVQLKEKYEGVSNASSDCES